MLARDDLLVPLTDIIKEVGLEDFGPRALDWYRNELWMYPYDYNFNYLFYRKDWFAAKKSATAYRLEELPANVASAQRSGQ